MAHQLSGIRILTPEKYESMVLPAGDWILNLPASIHDRGPYRAGRRASHEQVAAGVEVTGTGAEASSGREGSRAAAVLFVSRVHGPAGLFRRRLHALDGQDLPAMIR